MYDAINRQRKNAGLEDLVPGSIELTVEEIFRGRGNLLPAVDCDMRRMLWNFAHIEPISTGSEIGNSQFITKVNRDNAIMGTLVFRDIGSKIMRGDLSDIDKVYASRINEVAQKSLGTAGIKGFAGFSVRIQGWMYGDFASRVNLTLINQGYPAIASRFAVKVGQLVRESEFLKSNLINKPDGDGSGFPKQYSEAEIRTFREICDAVLERLFNIYSVPVRDRKRYRIRASQGKFPPTTPYKRYDSLADPGHIRTLVRPLATYTAESDEING
ncbi:hypothetical protein A2Z33_01570 [Candidatus Gottesmanbacteria bacterium RBG_16_52_11]|uniref:Uncharacterized protein n=1 Tax=Candidatus Gottesmanbacteria bacterium RBG_16_52_11 TaxID=1798374 RepID=A0A1F5YNY8_9BACT|nr:MAG: hypothetical protein A2Z33_01570 [Candidatus Gottesmanbacteria bacterium RBG_16_52_11]